MKLKFDSAQAYQLEAVKILVDLFEGRPQQSDDYAVEKNTSGANAKESFFQTELGIGSRIELSAEALYKKLCTVQDRNNVDVARLLSLIVSSAALLNANK